MYTHITTDLIQIPMHISYRYRLPKLKNDGRTIECLPTVYESRVWVDLKGCGPCSSRNELILHLRSSEINVNDLEELG